MFWEFRVYIFLVIRFGNTVSLATTESYNNNECNKYQSYLYSFENFSLIG